MQIKPLQSINQNKPISHQSIHIQNIPILDITSPDFPSLLISHLKNLGFVILTKHSLNSTQIDNAFQISKNFFNQPIHLKKSIKYNVHRSRGYLSSMQQVLGDNKLDDKKQALNIGYFPVKGQQTYYPQNKQFRQYFTTFYQKLFAINLQILKAFQIGFQLKQGFLVNKCSDISNQTLRLLFYPELDRQSLQKLGSNRIGAHSDYGTLTLLLQKPGYGQSGLRVLSRNNQWIRIIPPDYSLVLNIGDLFQRWTNDVLISTIHKVEVDEQIMDKLKNGQMEKVPQRQTIVMFCDPDIDVIVECLQGCGIAKYEGIKGKDYVVGRLLASKKY